MGTPRTHRAEGVRLRRTVGQRLRLEGLLEWISWILLACGGFAVASGPVTGPARDLVLVGAVFFIAPLLVRVAVATEYVEADDDGIGWRSLFRRAAVPWSDVARIELGEMTLAPRPNGKRVLVVRLASGRRRKLRPSARYRPEHANEWLAAASRLGSVPVELAPPFRIVAGLTSRSTARWASRRDG